MRQEQRFILCFRGQSVLSCPCSLNFPSEPSCEVVTITIPGLQMRKLRQRSARLTQLVTWWRQDSTQVPSPRSEVPGAAWPGWSGGLTAPSHEDFQLPAGPTPPWGDLLGHLTHAGQLRGKHGSWLRWDVQLDA